MNQLSKWILAGIVTFQLSHSASAQQSSLDPVEKRKQRNAQLEKVSPTMDRLQSMSLKPNEIVSKNISEVARSLKQVEEVLDTLSLIGDRHDQAAVLLDVDKDSLSMLNILLSKEGERVAALKKITALQRQASSKSKDNIRSNGLALVPNKPKPVSLKQRSVATKHQEIKPVLAKVFHNQDRPAKAILKVGKEFSKTVYVGQTFSANQIDYTLISVEVVGDNERVPGRKIYQIVLRDPQGSDKILIWD